MNCEKEVFEESVKCDVFHNATDTVNNDKNLVIDEEAIAYAENLNQKLKSLSPEKAERFMQSFERHVILLPKRGKPNNKSTAVGCKLEESDFVVIDNNEDCDPKNIESAVTKTAASVEMPPSEASFDNPDVPDYSIITNERLPHSEFHLQKEKFTVESTSPNPKNEEEFQDCNSDRQNATSQNNNLKEAEKKLTSNDIIKTCTEIQAFLNKEIFIVPYENNQCYKKSHDLKQEYLQKNTHENANELGASDNSLIFQNNITFDSTASNQVQKMTNTENFKKQETETVSIPLKEIKNSCPKELKAALPNLNFPSYLPVKKWFLDQLEKLSQPLQSTSKIRNYSKSYETFPSNFQQKYIPKLPPKMISFSAVQSQVANVLEQNNDWLERTEISQQALTESPKKSINILILGQTGVGKSTWINAFANYLIYDTLEDAIKGKAPICVIPTKFSLLDNQYQRHEILLGNHANEIFSNNGQSATQNAKTYLLEKDDLNIYLIDTPGMEDTRGPEQDDENVRKILRAIAPFKELHAICFLFKANESRLSQSFRYCIGKLLGNLSKSALNNISFVFTNARGTFYKPGDTMNSLISYFEELKAKEKLEVQLTDDKIFCLDNEAFRFICAYFSKINFMKSHTMTYGESWRQSSNEVKLLLRYASRLRPHITSETLSINETKTWICQLIYPIINVSNIIQYNLQQHADRIKELEALENNIEKLREKAAIPIFSLQIIPLKKPQTVCKSHKCVSYVKVDGFLQPLPKTVCHKNCTIGFQFSDPYKIPDPALQYCDVFWRNRIPSSTCQKCGCHLQYHQRIFYTRKIVTNYAETYAIKTTLTSQTDALKLKLKMIHESEKMSQGYRQEFEFLISAMAKFSLFLFRNGVSQKVDVFEKHLEKAVERKKIMMDNVPNCDDRKYHQLANLLKSYRTVRERIIHDYASINLSLNDVQDIRQKLFAMPLMGSKISEIFDIHVEAAYQDHANEITVIDKKPFLG